MSPSSTSDLILGTPIAITNMGNTCDRIISLARRAKPAYVCFATAHMLAETRRDEAVRAAYSSAAMITPDGTPVAWCLKWMGHSTARCVSGPRAMPALLTAAAENGITVGFYGGRQETLNLMAKVISERFPRLSVVYSCSPPFRALKPEEQSEHLQKIVSSGVQLLFVGLGSPKQEIWMHRFSPSLNCVCLGVGAAFEFLSGEKILPPSWVQAIGLTWLVRLCQEPRRLAKRNLQSPVFAAMFLRERLTNWFRNRLPGSVVGRNGGVGGPAQ